MTSDRFEQILSLSGEHLVLVAVSIAMACVIAIPAAILLSRKPGPRRIAVAIANILQTIPSLAMFGFLIPIPLIGGIGKTTAIVALVVYALLPLMRNTLAGILGVDPAVRESAVAMGMTPTQVLRQVELPLAAPTIMAGLRIATVTSIGTAVIAAAIGGGGLGVLIFGGISLNDSSQILSGAIPAAIMALIADEGLGWLERTDIATRLRRVAVALAVAAGIAGTAGCGSVPRVVVGSKNFAEQLLLGEIVAQQIERRVGVHVERKFQIGGTMLAHEALVKGDIDLYPEYTGTALTAVLKRLANDDPALVLAQVRNGYKQWGLRWMDPLGFDDTFAMVIRREDAEGHHIKTLSDAGAYASGWKLGAGYEFVERADGLAGLQKAYGLRWKEKVRTMDLGLLYAALDQHQVDMAAANSTDGQLSNREFVTLEDDKHYFPPYQAAFVVRDASLARIPGLEGALKELSGALTTEEMRNLNHQLQGLHRPGPKIAAEWLAKLKR